MPRTQAAMAGSAGCAKTEAPRAKGVLFARARAWVGDAARMRRAMGAKSSVCAMGMRGVIDERRVGVK